MKGIQNDGKGIVIGKGIIPSQLGGQDSFRLTIKTPDPKVKVLLVVKSAHFRSLTDRHPFVGVPLQEFASYSRILPGLLIQESIQDGRFLNLRDSD